MSAYTFRSARAVIASVAACMTVLAGCAGPSAALTAAPGSVAVQRGATAPRDAAAAANAAVQENAATGHDADAVAAAAAPGAASAAAPSVAAPAASGATPATNTAADTLAPGLYALDRLASTISGTTAMIQARRSCPDVVDELRAGQWSLTSPKGGLSPLGVSMAMLSYGDLLAVLLLKGSDTSCAGIVTVSTPAEISAGGKLAAAKTEQELPVSCHVGPDPMGDDLDNLILSYSGVFFSDAGAFMLTVAGPATAGPHTLTMDDEGSSGVQLMVFKADSSVTDATLALLGMYSGSGGSDDEGVPEAFSHFQAMYTGGGTLTVTSTDPWQATITTTLTGGDASAYVTDDESDDESDDATNPALNQKVTLTAPLHCDT